MRTPTNEIDNVIYPLLDNANCGLRLITNSDQKYEVAELNLRASEKAMTSSAYHSAEKYLTAGRSLLDRSSWEMEYDLTLKLYNAASVCFFANVFDSN